MIGISLTIQARHTDSNPLAPNVYSIPPLVTTLTRLSIDNIYVRQMNINLNKLTNMSKQTNKLTTKRFVIRKSLIGTNTVITFVTKKGKSVTYNHDEVYEKNKERFESMNCFKKYKSYTNTNNIPTFCR